MGDPSPLTAAGGCDCSYARRIYRRTQKGHEQEVWGMGLQCFENGYWVLYGILDPMALR